jgi:hypothetical protein
MNADEDIRRLLRGAFGPEPPMRLDRAEVFRRGRRAVRLRRITASGGVAATVVAVAVGVALLPGLGKPVPNPAHGSDTAVPTSTQPTTFTLPPVPRGRMPRTDDKRAAELTEVLARSGVFPAGLEIVPLGRTDVPMLRFQHDGLGYFMIKDVRDRHGLGGFDLRVGFPSDAPARRCDVVEEGQLSCQEDREPGAWMWVRTFQAPHGTVAYHVSAVRDDGTRVTVASSAVPHSTTGVRGWRPGRLVPPVSVGVLMQIAALPGLSYF